MSVNQNFFIRKMFFSMVGIIILSLGLNLIVKSTIGISPFDLLSLAIGEILNIQSFGNASLVMQSLILVICLMFCKKAQIHLSELIVSFLSVFLITRIINLTFIVTNYIDANQYFLYILGILLLSIGVSLNIKANLIIAPTDKLVVISSKMLKIKSGTSKIFIDCMVFTTVLILKSTLNLDINLTIITFISIFALGTLINLNNKLYLNKFYNVVLEKNGS